MNKAANLLTPEARQSAMRRQLIDKLEGIIRESVKPMERIEGIRVLHVEGLGGSPGGGNGSGNGNGNIADSVVNSALRFRAQAPLVDQLLREIGVQGGDLGNAANSLLEGNKKAMIKVYTSSVIEAPADAVWAQVRDFNGLPKWTPFVAESRIENNMPADRIGCVRNFRLRDGGVIREQLLTLSDYDYQCSYSILESPMGVENYVATLKLTPVTDGNKTFAEWWAEFDCAPEKERELAQGIGQGVFQAAFASKTSCRGISRRAQDPLAGDDVIRHSSNAFRLRLSMQKLILENPIGVQSSADFRFAWQTWYTELPRATARAQYTASAIHSIVRRELLDDVTRSARLWNGSGDRTRAASREGWDRS